VAAAVVPLCLLLLADQARAADTHLIAVGAPPEQTCPGPRQVADALSARLPGIVLPHDQAVRPGMLRLAIAPDPGGGIRVDLVDPDGAPLLHRVLAATRGPDACPALADTVALIIERYWREVGYEPQPVPAAPPTPPQPPAPPPTPPPAPPPPPVVTPAAPPAAVETRTAAPPPEPPRAPGGPLRWSAAAAVAGRAGDTGTRDAAALITLGVEGHIGVQVSGGVSNGSSAMLKVGQANFRRFPIRLGAYLPVHLGVGQLEPGVGVDFELLSYASQGDNGVTQLQAPTACSARVCGSPGADLGLGWSYASSHHVYLRALARAGVAVAYDFLNRSAGSTDNGDPIWRTPRTYLELALESGLWFP